MSIADRAGDRRALRSRAEDSAARHRRRTPPIDRPARVRTTLASASQRSRSAPSRTGRASTSKKSPSAGAMRHDVDIGRPPGPLQHRERRTRERQLQHERSAVVGDAAHDVETARRARDVRRVVASRRTARAGGSGSRSKRGEPRQRRRENSRDRPTLSISDRRTQPHGHARLQWDRRHQAAPASALRSAGSTRARSASFA